ncbi:hypothetical protein EX895_005643 [Sporisorium graminicola]|uniref:Uncharacterized protein n=1 Tax=Sporisorium graminicola TaxID=280036 RepID=A0A4U7KMI3_9BASI|nr:hypothetical protein EX895_005643 [Sporisorium graminicola]TKY85481.1 hypothetical protein EX895_005643 [Sporisorium graminicola]
MTGLSLAGRTAFITGGSRGIGLEIGKSLASRGANVIIAAKTASPHPKLPGTIYTACDEIASAASSAGSDAVAHPVQLDIRDAGAVETAINDAAARFGGLDIVINNASAINMAPTHTASVKSYDLMNGINSRGTWLVSRFALPHLLESAEKNRNPHVVTLSPPLNFNTLSTTPGSASSQLPPIFPQQFAQTASAYTIAKFGMSLLTLGLAAETFGKIAVNSLWPYTLIATSAMKIVSKDAAVQERRWRNPSIVAEATARLVEENAESFTGQFLVDELYLRQKGLTLDQIKKFNVDESTPLDNLAEDLYISQELRDAIQASRQ